MGREIVDTDVLVMELILGKKVLTVTNTLDDTVSTFEWILVIVLMSFVILGGELLGEQRGRALVDGLLGAHCSTR